MLTNCHDNEYDWDQLYQKINKFMNYFLFSVLKLTYQFVRFKYVKYWL